MVARRGRQDRRQRSLSVHAPGDLRISASRLARLYIRGLPSRTEQERETGPHAMVRLLARVVGVGIETADMLVNEVLSRPMRDRKAVARYAGLTGSPDESGAKRREQGLARASNVRVRRGMIQLAWRFLLFQKESALALWYRVRTADSRLGTRNDDRRTGTQANDRALALCHDWRHFGGRRPASAG